MVSRFALDKTGALIAITTDGDVWRSTDHGASFPQRATDIGERGPITGHSGGLVALAMNPAMATSTPAAKPASGLTWQDNGVTWAYFGLAGTVVTSSRGDNLDPNGYKDNLLQSHSIVWGSCWSVGTSARARFSGLPRVAGGCRPRPASTAIPKFTASCLIGRLAGSTRATQEPAGARAEACSPPSTTGRRGRRSPRATTPPLRQGADALVRTEPSMSWARAVRS